MAKLMEELSNLSIDLQSKILSALSSENTAIEINNKLYVVPIQVMKLINSLNSDIEDLEEVINKGINETSVYKKN
tara:strand:+ start:1226 stop:1450 length:225 start_codon:yes stop_codon:yes gene_type:complete